MGITRGIIFGIFCLLIVLEFGILVHCRMTGYKMTNDQEQIMSLFDPTLLDEFDQICRGGHARYRNYPASELLEHDGRAAAACTYCHMYEDAIRRWTDHPGIVALDVRGRRQRGFG